MKKTQKTLDYPLHSLLDAQVQQQWQKPIHSLVGGHHLEKKERWENVLKWAVQFRLRWRVLWCLIICMISFNNFWNITNVAKMGKIRKIMFIHPFKSPCSRQSTANGLNLQRESHEIIWSNLLQSGVFFHLRCWSSSCRRWPWWRRRASWGSCSPCWSRSSPHHGPPRSHRGSGSSGDHRSLPKIEPRDRCEYKAGI